MSLEEDLQLAWKNKTQLIHSLSGYYPIDIELVSKKSNNVLFTTDRLHFVIWIQRGTERLMEKDTEEY